MPESNEPLPLHDLESLLQETLGPSIKVKSTTWKNLTDPGENFGSLIISIDVNVLKDNKPETLHLVCKMPPDSDYLLNLFNSPISFFKEIYFYSKISPIFLKFQLENGIDKDNLIKLVPQFYGGRMSLNGLEQFDSQAAIIMENLNFSGYSSPDRVLGMDREHMEFGVKELAKLHALVIAYKEKNPNEFEEIFKPVFIPTANEMAMKCVGGMINNAVQDLKNMKEAQPYMEMIRKTLEHDVIMRHKETGEENWKTLIHNDFWVNNMLFKYDNSGKINSMKIVDFQLTFYDYGVKDLIFFLISSAKKDVIDNHLNDLITLYYETFIDFLKSVKIDVKKFSRENFDKILKESAPLKFSQCIMMVQVIKATPGTAPDVNSVKSEEEFLSIEKGKNYDEKLIHVLQTFVKQNWLIK